MYKSLIELARSLYPAYEFVPLHAPVFDQAEREGVLRCLDSTFVSTAGPDIALFEAELAQVTKAAHVIGLGTGTAALHMALLAAGVEYGDLVLTQPLSFVATANACAHIGALPAFADIQADTLGLDPKAVESFFTTRCARTAKGLVERESGRRVAACVPMHTFGLPCAIAELVELCSHWGVPVVEDAAESLGSFKQGRHTGTFGLLGILSFNGNKTITCGAGGAILTDDEELAKLVRHRATTAKLPHPFRYEHDQVGYNYRLPNLNAALGLAQIKKLPAFLEAKRAVHAAYADFFADRPETLVSEGAECVANYWLNALILPEQSLVEPFLVTTNAAGVQTRPAWGLLHEQPMYRDCPRGSLDVAEDIGKRLVNLPSGPGWRGLTDAT